MVLNNLPSCAQELSKIVEGEMIGDNRMISSIVTNTKECDIFGSCFVAINNGKNYIQEAVQKGAVLIITDEKIQTEATVIYVKDILKAVGLLGRHNKGKTKIIGITGSVGKTTTREMLTSVLSQKFKVCSTKFNYNNELGLALTLLSIKDEDYCVAEMGMRHKGDIQYLASLCEPDISIITNCGSSHREFFEDRNGIVREKSEIAKYTKDLAVLPNEPFFQDISIKALNKIYTGIGGDCYAENIVVGEQIEFDAAYRNEKIKSIVINSIYGHNISNALNVIAVAKYLHIDNDLIRVGIYSFKNESLREERYNINGAEVIVDCYNACFESMKSAVVSVTDYAKKHGKEAVLVLGDMLELGEETEFLHRSIGELAKEREIKNMYLFGKHCDEYIKGYKKGNKYTDLEELSKEVKKELDYGKIVLIKASRAMNFEKIIENLRK